MNDLKYIIQYYKTCPVDRYFFLASFVFLMIGVSTGNHKAFGAAITLALFAIYLKESKHEQ